MAGGEDEAEDVVVDVSRAASKSPSASSATLSSSMADLLQLLARLTSRRMRSMARRRAVDVSHAPGLWACRRGAMLEGLDEGVLGEVLGETDVADDARDDSRHLGGLHAPDRLDRAPHGLVTWSGVLVSGT